MTDELVPLYHVDTKVTINNNIAEIKYEQFYYNQKSEPIEAEYMFPSHSEAVFSEIQLRFQDKVICTRIEEREVAKAKFEDAVASNKTAVMSAPSRANRDITIVNLGNLPPKSEIVVLCTFYQALEVEDLSWSLFIPAKITPRFIGELPNCGGESHNEEAYGSMEFVPNEEVKHELLDNVSEANRAYYQSLDFTNEFEVWINSSSPITRIVSLSHDIDVNMLDDKDTKARVKLIDLATLPGCDFKLLFRNEEINKPMILSQKLGNEYALMVSFLADMTSKSEIESRQCFVWGKVDMEPSIAYENFSDCDIRSNEYYFVLDRSGSMWGRTIETAKEALILFLRSIPPGSSFNIISFGSDFSKMYSSAVEYTQENLENSISEVEQFKADLGGTEIYNPLDDIFKNIDTSSQLDKHVYLLTDGQVFNTDAVIKLIKQNNKNFIVHSIGIGNDVSTALVVGTAKAGRGKYYFVNNKAEGLEEIIIDSLSRSFVPYMKIGEQKVDTNGELLIQSSELTDPELKVIHGDQLTYYAVIGNLESSELEGTIKLKMVNSSEDEAQDFEFDLTNQWTKIEGDSIFKLIASKRIKEFTDANDRESAISTSVKYQVPCYYTSFFAAEKLINKESGLVQYDKVKIMRFSIILIQSLNIYDLSFWHRLKRMK